MNDVAPPLRQLRWKQAEQIFVGMGVGDEDIAVSVVVIARKEVLDPRLRVEMARKLMNPLHAREKRQRLFQAARGYADAGIGKEVTEQIDPACGSRRRSRIRRLIIGPLCCM